MRTHDQLADFVNQGVVFLPTPAVGDSSECPQRSCFATTVCAKDVRPTASANRDTPMTVDTSNGPSVYEEEVPVWDALGEVLRRSGLSTRPGACWYATCMGQNVLPEMCPRTRHISNEHARVNDALGSLGQAVRAAAQATHSLTCGVPDRESNEIKYLREATELIERWQQQLQDGQPVSGPPSEHSEVILIER